MASVPVVLRAVIETGECRGSMLSTRSVIDFVTIVSNILDAAFHMPHMNTRENKRISREMLIKSTGT